MKQKDKLVMIRFKPTEYKKFEKLFIESGTRSKAEFARQLIFKGAK